MTAAMAESVVDDEAMAILGAASEAEDGSKLAYITTGLAVRLAPTPPYEAPDTEEFMKGHSVDKLTPDVGGFRVAALGTTCATVCTWSGGTQWPPSRRRRLGLSSLK